MIADPHAPECPCARCKGPAWRHAQQDAKDRQRHQKVTIRNNAAPHSDADLIEQALADEDTAFDRWCAADGTSTFQEWQDEQRHPPHTVSFVDGGKYSREHPMFVGGRPSVAWSRMIPGQITYIDKF